MSEYLETGSTYQKRITTPVHAQIYNSWSIIINSLCYVCLRTTDINDPTVPTMNGNRFSFLFKTSSQNVYMLAGDYFEHSVLNLFFSTLHDGKIMFTLIFNVNVKLLLNGEFVTKCASFSRAIICELPENNELKSIKMLVNGSIATNAITNSCYIVPFAKNETEIYTDIVKNISTLDASKDNRPIHRHRSYVLTYKKIVLINTKKTDEISVPRLGNRILPPPVNTIDTNPNNSSSSSITEPIDLAQDQDQDQEEIEDTFHTPDRPTRPRNKRPDRHDCRKKRKHNDI